MTNNPEFKNFDKAVRKILTVSREELRRREEEWKRGQHGKKRGPKPSASVRASRAKG